MGIIKFLFTYKKVKIKLDGFSIFINIDKINKEVVMNYHLNNRIYIGNYIIKNCCYLKNIKNFVYENVENAVAFDGCHNLIDCQANVIKKFVIKNEFLFVYIKRIKK
jgi:hypothetical protein